MVISENDIIEYAKNNYTITKYKIKFLNDIGVVGGVAVIFDSKFQIVNLSNKKIYLQTIGHPSYLIDITLSVERYFKINKLLK